MGGKAFKRRLAPSVSVLIVAWNNFLLLLNVLLLMCWNIKPIYSQFLNAYALLCAQISSYMIYKNRNRYQQCFNLLIHVYSIYIVPGFRW